jgi:Zn-dependent peptidase ImmA (M78 family)/DNA-binding XRE family transcriptional regulator
MIGSRIKQARMASGQSLRDLAAKAGISAMAISKYEREESTPSSGILLALSQALGIRVEYFFRNIQVNLREVEYRKHAKLPKKLLQQIEGDVMEQVERYIELEEILPVCPIQLFVVPEGLPDKVKDYDDIEHIASHLRNAWDLGRTPIQDLTGALEERGIKIIQSNALHGMKFDGLAARVNGAPVIVVGSEWPGDRRRFTLAHELGHLILKGRLGRNLDEEVAANRFAGAFLVPAAEVYKELGLKRTWFEPRELCVLKKAYGLSMNAWLHRAHELGIINDATKLELIKYFRKLGWHKQEPCDDYPREQPQVFMQLVFHALAEDLITESKAAELMGLSIIDFRAIRNVDNVKAAVNR